jgi:hypothetical protein
MKFQNARSVLGGLLLLCAVPAPAQITTVHLPDSNAGSGAACNMIPFSSVFGTPAGSWTHLTVVPAAMLASQGVQPGHKLVDIRFAPCGSGTVQIPSVQVVVGHLVSPLPTFSLLNGFADQTPVYDSATRGALGFACVANTWCSLGVGGGGFAWDGLSDVGIYTSHAGLTISSTTGWQGSFWRAAALMRHYVNSYQASMALTSSLSALKMALTFADPLAMPATATAYGQGTPGSAGVPIFDAPEAPSFGNFAFGLGVAQAWPGGVAVLMLSSAPADAPIGLASDVRVLVDLSPASASLLVPLPVGPAGTASLSLPLPTFDPGLAGFSVWCQWAVLGDPSGQPTVLNLPLALTAGLGLTLGV